MGSIKKISDWNHDQDIELRYLRYIHEKNGEDRKSDVSPQQNLNYQRFIAKIDELINLNKENTRRVLSAQAKNTDSILQKIQLTKSESGLELHKKIELDNAQNISELHEQFNWQTNDHLWRAELSFQEQSAELNQIDSELIRGSIQYFNIAKELIKKGLEDEALGYLLKSESIYKVNYQTQHSLGRIFLNKKQYRKASKYFLYAVKYATANQFKSSAAISYLHAATCCYLQGQDSRAELCAKEAIRLYPSIAQSYFDYCKYKAARGDFDVDCLENAIRLNQDFIYEISNHPEFMPVIDELIEFILKSKHKLKTEIEQLELIYKNKKNLISHHIAESCRILGEKYEKMKISDKDHFLQKIQNLKNKNHYKSLLLAKALLLKESEELHTFYEETKKKLINKIDLIKYRMTSRRLIELLDKRAKLIYYKDVRDLEILQRKLCKKIIFYAKIFTFYFIQKKLYGLMSRKHREYVTCRNEFRQNARGVIDYEERKNKIIDRFITQKEIQKKEIERIWGFQ